MHPGVMPGCLFYTTPARIEGRAIAFMKMFVADSHFGLKYLCLFGHSRCSVVSLLTPPSLPWL